MRRISMLAAVGLCMVLGGAARAQSLNQVRVGDMPGTRGKWQTGEVVVAAPIVEVQRWFSDSRYWAQRFPDDSEVRELGRLPDGRRRVSFHSAALGKTLTVTLRERPGLISYEGSGHDVTTQGRIFFQELGPARTRIVMQTTGELHGLTGVFGTEGVKRKRAVAKLNADLNAAVRLSKQWATIHRPSFG